MKGCSPPHRDHNCKNWQVLFLRNLSIILNGFNLYLGKTDKSHLCELQMQAGANFVQWGILGVLGLNMGGEHDKNIDRR